MNKTTNIYKAPPKKVPASPPRSSTAMSLAKAMDALGPGPSPVNMDLPW